MTDTIRSSTRWNPSTYACHWFEAVQLISEGITLDLVQQINLPSDAHILEIGFGSCKWSASFAIMGYKVTAIDKISEMIDQAKQNFPNINIEYVVDELPNLKSEASKRKYDLVFNEGVIEHFLDRTERVSAIYAMGDCCIAGGFVFIIVPFLSSESDEYRYTSIREFADEVKEAGLAPIYVNTMVFQTEKKVYTMLRALAKKVRV